MGEAVVSKAVLGEVAAGKMGGACGRRRAACVPSRERLSRHAMTARGAPGERMRAEAAMRIAAPASMEGAPTGTKSAAGGVEPDRRVAAQGLPQVAGRAP